jgi:hypothetical protein
LTTKAASNSDTQLQQTKEQLQWCFEMMNQVLIFYRKLLKLKIRGVSVSYQNSSYEAITNST